MSTTLAITLALAARLVVIDGGGNDSGIGDDKAWSYRLYRELFLAGESSGDDTLTALVLTYADPVDADWMRGAHEIADYLAWVGRSVAPRVAATAMTVPDRATAESDAVEAALLQADVVFLRGGDQGKYYDLWNDTRLEKALRAFLARGGVLGGTSAGSMSTGSHCFCGSYGPVSYELLQDGQSPQLRDESDPKTSGVHTDFLGILPDTFVETHFTQRGRLGRMLAVLAEAHAVTPGRAVLGIALEAQTGVIVRNGFATVMGMGEVLFARQQPDALSVRRKGRPPIYTPLSVDRLIEGQTYDLKNRRVVDAPLPPRQRKIPSFLDAVVAYARAGDSEVRALQHELVFDDLARDTTKLGVLSFEGSSVAREGTRLRFGVAAPGTQETSAIVIDASAARAVGRTPWAWTYEPNGARTVAGLHGLTLHVLASPWAFDLVTRTPVRVMP